MPLQSSAKLPRPVNPYVKLRLGGTERRTTVLSNSKNPVWGGQVWYDGWGGGVVVSVGYVSTIFKAHTLID